MDFDESGSVIGLEIVPDDDTMKIQLLMTYCYVKDEENSGTSVWGLERIKCLGRFLGVSFEGFLLEIMQLFSR